MKPMGKEDTKKALGLIGAILVVFVLAGWRIVGAKPAPAAAPAETTSGSTSSTSDATTPKADDQGEDATIEVPSIFAMGSADPFKWLVKPDHGQLMGKPLGSSMALGGNLPSGPLTPLPMAGGYNKVQPVKEEEPKLTGVLPGPNAVAVVEVGDTSYVVRRGERFAGYTLDTIGTDRVAVVHDGKRSRLVLGE